VSVDDVYVVLNQMLAVRGERIVHARIATLGVSQTNTVSHLLTIKAIFRAAE
jgi:hypothetical protein